MAIRYWLIGLLALLLGGCHGALHRLPEIGSSDIAAARHALAADTATLSSRRLSLRQASTRLRRTIARVHDAGVAVCEEIGVARCDWRYVVVRDHQLNGAAGWDGEIYLNHGVVEETRNEAEIALLIAHEMAHQAAGHPATARRLWEAGWTIGWTVGHALDAFSGFGGGQGGPFTAWGVACGTWIGGLLWSRQREREADAIAAVIVHRAGLDLDRARRLGFRLAHDDGQVQSGPFDSHPLGAERLAVIDRAIAAARASGGRLPPRADGSPAGWVR